MSFEIPPVESPATYLDIAFKAARTKAAQKRSSLKVDRLQKIQMLELVKLETVNDTLNMKLSKVITDFPNFDNLTEFYNELVRNLMDYKELKKSLGALNWAKGKISEFTRQYKTKIRKCADVIVITSYSKQYFGRISSVIKQISKNLKFLEETRKIMRGFPSVKDGMFTIAIAGFPNIGKSTLLSKLTSAKPDIKPYAFTTKGLNVGYMMHGVHKIQFIDTPGTLDREDKMNPIERTANLAIKYCAHMIIYIYDLSEHYSIKDQKKLFENLKDFDKPVILYMSKTDILDKKLVADFKKNNKNIYEFEELKNKIIAEFNEFRS